MGSLESCPCKLLLLPSELQRMLRATRRQAAYAVTFLCFRVTQLPLLL